VASAIALEPGISTDGDFGDTDPATDRDLGNGTAAAAETGNGVPADTGLGDAANAGLGDAADAGLGDAADAGLGDAAETGLGGAADTDAGGAVADAGGFNPATRRGARLNASRWTWFGAGALVGGARRRMTRRPELRCGAGT
jgi:hypothetical protein